jgi:hypothetical protein
MDIPDYPCFLETITFVIMFVFSSGPLSSTLKAGDQFALAPGSATPVQAEQTASTRYGLFNLLDHRSSYGQGVFPEPFLIDDSDLETNEARLDWLHTEGFHQRSDVVTAEIEKGFGLLTLEAEVPYERDNAEGVTAEGIGNIDLGARYPIFQYVSGNGIYDTTFGAAVEVGVPTNSSVSKNTEIVPKIFNDLKLGDHFTLQTIVGYSKLLGPGEDGGSEVLEYGFVFGCTIPHSDLPIPGVLQVIPVFELSGETQLNHDDRGQTILQGTAAMRVNLKTLGNVQPRLGFGFVFPINSNARSEEHWGLVTSLVFEY